MQEVTWQEAILLYKDTKRLVIWSCTRTLARGIGVVQAVMARSLLRNRGGCAILFLSTIFSGDPLIRCPVSGRQVRQHFSMCGSFVVLDCAVGDVVYILPPICICLQCLK
jgi:hypothetical protein